MGYERTAALQIDHDGWRLAFISEAVHRGKLKYPGAIRL